MNADECMLQLALIETTEPDTFQQGYKSAPILCEFTGAPVNVLLETLLDAMAEPGRPVGFQERDKGAAQWCRDQLEKKEND